MENLKKGKTTLYLGEPDQAGNIGYSLTYSYSYNDENILDTFSYVDLKFSGPGSWDEYSCGDVYPIDKMIQLALSDQDSK